MGNSNIFAYLCIPMYCKNQHFKFLLVFITVALFVKPVFAQDISYSISSKGVYEFLDELANNNIISVCSVVQPYSRMYIAKLLEEADKKRDLLSIRQQKELDFYLKDFGKELYNGKNWDKRFDFFYYKDSLFSLSGNLIMGAEIFYNSSGKATYWHNGADVRAYVGKWGFYASLRDNHEKPLLGLPEYLTKREGGHIKNSTDWSEMRGGVTYSWSWGNAGLIKDAFTWGSNYNGANIFGGRNPTFIHLKLQLYPVKWFRFNYFHGWLNSMVIDSSRSYWVTNSYGTNYREVYHKKFIAANLFTFIPLNNLYISAGNSIIYSDLDVFPAYLVPVFFYKSVDHSVNSGINNMNSQMFMDFSSRQIKHLHVYATVFADEFSFNRVFKKNEWNFMSWKAGFRLTDFPLSNTSLTFEFTYNYPLTYQHFVPTLTYESNNYNLGHYLKDNSREWFISFSWKPLRAFTAEIWYLNAVRGPDYNELGGSRIGNPPLSSIEWQDRNTGFRAEYQIINDLYTWLVLTAGNISGDNRWSHPYFQGKKISINAGFTFGF